MCEGLLAALEETFEKLPGSKSKMGFAGRLGVSVDTIYKTLQGTRKKQDLVDLIIELVNYSGDLSPLQCIASQCNSMVVPLKSGFNQKDNTDIFKSIKELSDYAGTVAEGLADNKLGKTEAKKMLMEAEEAFRQLGVAIQLLKEVSRG